MVCPDGQGLGLVGIRSALVSCHMIKEGWARSGNDACTRLRSPASDLGIARPCPKPVVDAQRMQFAVQSGKRRSRGRGPGLEALQQVRVRRRHLVDPGRGGERRSSRTVDRAAADAVLAMAHADPSSVPPASSATRSGSPPSLSQPSCVADSSRISRSPWAWHTEAPPCRLPVSGRVQRRARPIISSSTSASSARMFNDGSRAASTPDTRSVRGSTSRSMSAYGDLRSRTAGSAGRLRILSRRVAAASEQTLMESSSPHFTST